MKNNDYNVLISEAGEKVLSGAETWTEYPRPQLKRDNWQILKEGWTLNGKAVKVPFPPQALLSGYDGEVDDNLTYVCNFKRCKQEMDNIGKRTILHFGAVDQIAEVYLNGMLLGRHEGGYLPFSFDITDAIKDDNKLVVDVTDKLSPQYPYGKQTRKRGGMWYTPVSGIWQNVWMEQVSESYVEKLKITPDDHSVRIAVTMNNSSVVQDKVEKLSAESLGFKDNQLKKRIQIELHNGEIYEETFETDEIYVDLSNILLTSGCTYEPKTWSVESPYIYKARVLVGEDVVETYFALRKIEIKSIDGINRVCLNDKPIFMNGVLDQGYYCDGIFLPAEEAEYERDILRMKELGINMLRKHIKVEPECFYYYCDIHGMLVMQDMVNNGSYSFMRDTALPTVGFTKRRDTNHRIDKETKQFFEKHMVDTIEHLYNHPSIVAYTIFNEGWGQFDSDRMYAIAKKTDDTRLYDSTSGWFAQKDNDFDSYHVYFNKKVKKPGKRPLFLSEFGGFTYVVPDHVYSKDKSYGYGTCKSKEELCDKIIKRYEELILPIVKKGACGSVYTQFSDVEDEVNGFYTYDRKVCKVDAHRMQELAQRIEVELHS